ncbi:nitrogenase iron-iron protein beta chain [Methanobrevibacter cuticularis]|uniref:Nitrogenase iron-iron protein beta chain n=1 Tax=Methanobrevibacter cuticularis TaxID=47311 RepID=A0A166CJ87_9EURY|nr:nitrogenase component 1 [Methanobrevibacter cuticularis]KZX14797.1 nitrogenase iron-iron protein beta chain [Methanobrevibacter cuticularis]
MSDNKSENYIDESSSPRIVEAPRYGCTLSGAYEAAVGLNEGVPILHSGSGCGMSQLFGANYGGAQNAPGDYGGSSTPCSCLVEEHVIFGGEDKLRKLIDSTIKISTGEFFTVISGCVPSLIGDDVDAVVNEFRDKAPIIHVNAPGFKGNSFEGYELFFEALADQFLTPARRKRKTLVNILGIVPFQHIFWKGELRATKELLAKVGIEANVLFGEFDTVEKIQKIPAAAYNIVLSPWVGHRAANKLEKKFGTPYVSFPGVPTGPIQTTNFLRKLAEVLPINKRKLEDLIETEERRVYRGVEYAGDILQFDIPNVYFAVVADSNTAVSITRYLTDEVGQLPDIVIITDNPPKEYRENIINAITSTEEIEFTPDIIFEIDSFKISQLLKDRPFLNLYASSLESVIKDELETTHVTVSFPSYNRLVLGDNYVGYDGGLNLIQDLFYDKAGPL